MFAFLLQSDTTRANYIGPAYVVLLAAGAVAFETVARRPAWRWLPATSALLFILSGGVMSAIGLRSHAA